MARKKQLNPIATALTIAAVGITGLLVWKFIIQPTRNKMKNARQRNFVDSEITPSEILDAQFEVINT
jgi:hypothetical protein